MDVVYLLQESKSIRVPFFAYNPKLFHSFLRFGGYWDKQNNQFLFKDDLNIDEFKTSIKIPIVWLDCELSNKYTIYNFFNYQIDDKTIPYIYKNDFSKSDIPVDTALNHLFDFPKKILQKEYFSEYWLNKIDIELRSRKYSGSTYKSYIYYNRLICNTLEKSPNEINTKDVTEFIAMMEKERKYTASAMNIALSAIKFFFRYVLNRNDIKDHHRPHQDGRLPMILSKEEISKMLSMENNPKHRLLLMLVYSSGLRVSEVVALKKEHIDFSRKVMYIKLGKGRKDRSTLLSEKAAKYLNEYCEFFSIDKWIFPGQQPSRHLSVRSAQNIFEKAVNRIGINKKITIHGLRHTFATHLLESGTDIRYIQSLLGHTNLHTTERYTHVAKRNILNIQSPLDSI